MREALMAKGLYGIHGRAKWRASRWFFRVSRLSAAPKGCSIATQGNALGFMVQTIASPEGAIQRLCRSFRAGSTDHADPGRCPGLGVGRTVGAQTTCPARCIQRAGSPRSLNKTNHWGVRRLMVFRWACWISCVAPRRWAFVRMRSVG